jgi:mono/diheme cytochrome c family protein
MFKLKIVSVFKLRIVSVAVRKRGRDDAMSFLEGGPMTTSKMPWLMAGFVCLSLSSACGPEKPTAPTVTGDVGSGAADELHPEFLPNLKDLWSQERRPAPLNVSKAAASDYLSRAKRHHEFMQGGAPLEYRSSTSPYPATTRIILDGGRLYKSHCAICHGSKGLGDGEASRDLTPPPAFLAYLIDRPRSADKYLLWTISEGGVQFGTEMPAYKEVLTERQIWQIVIYMRADFPNIEEAGQS